MSILKELDLKQKDREPKLEDFNFLFKKKNTSKAYTRKYPNSIRISKTSISLRPGLIEKYQIQPGSYGAMILHEKKLGLVIRDKADPNLYAIQAGNKERKRRSFHINIPKISQKFTANFAGQYEAGESRVIESKYLIIDLIKIKEED